MISRISPNDQIFQGYELSVAEIARLFEMDAKSVHREILLIASRLLKRPLRIKRADGSLLLCNWIAEAVYRSGSLTVTPAPSLKPYLLELRERFTAVPLEQVSQLRSIYSIRIYQLLKQYSGIGGFKVEVLEFREMLAIEKKYSKFHELRRCVLDVAKEELDEKSDISFKLETLRAGRIITRLKFIIVKNKPKSSEKTKAGNITKSLEKIADAVVNQNTVNRWLFPEYWDEFLQYIEKEDPGLLPIIASDGPECMLVKVPYNKWSREFK